MDFIREIAVFQRDVDRTVGYRLASLPEQVEDVLAVDPAEMQRLGLSRRVDLVDMKRVFRNIASVASLAQAPTRAGADIFSKGCRVVQRLLRY